MKNPHNLPEAPPLSSPSISSVSVVVPVYRSADILSFLVERLKPVLERLHCPFELLLINDDSPDGSWSRIETLAAQYPWIRGVSLMRNFGQHNALLCGIREARYDIIVTMDDDLQNPPEEIVKLLTKLQENFDVVYGVPMAEKHGLWRNFASQITKLVLKNSMGVEVACNVSAFRGFRTSLREAFALHQSPHISIDVLLTWGTTRFSMVRVQHDARKSGESNYTLAKLVRHAFNMITGFSTLPLQIASMMGFAFTLVGVLVMVYVVGRYLLMGTTVPGFPFLASIIAIFSGVQLFSLGMIGEYIGRIHLRTLERPVYTVRTTSDRT